MSSKGGLRWGFRPPTTGTTFYNPVGGGSAPNHSIMNA
jgi:hypothetical protein